MKHQDSFMQQFQAARKEVAEMRTFMGDSAKVATLTFPPLPQKAKAGGRSVVARGKQR